MIEYIIHKKHCFGVDNQITAKLIRVYDIEFTRLSLIIRLCLKSQPTKPQPNLLK